jgi:SagB-type dehydrogenase family enzyme
MADSRRLSLERDVEAGIPEPLFLTYHVNSHLDRGATPLIDPRSPAVHEALRRSRSRPRGPVVSSTPGAAGTEPSPDWQTLARLARARRSVPSFGSGKLDAEELVSILRLAYGFDERRRVTTPSAGGLYPLTIWAVLTRTTAPSGLYEFDADAGGELIRLGGVPKGLLRASADPALVGQAAAIVLLLGLPTRSWWKYRERSYRLMLLEAGHLAQTLLLSATALQIASCPFMGFFELEAERELGIDGRSDLLLYSVLMGTPA